MLDFNVICCVYFILFSIYRLKLQNYLIMLQTDNSLLRLGILFMNKLNRIISGNSLTQNMLNNKQM